MIARSRPQSRRAARSLARTGVGVSAVMLAITAWTASSSQLPSASAVAVDGGPALVFDKPDDGSSIAPVALAQGGSATSFSLRLPQGAACTGDSANSNPPYLVQGYMVPGSVAPSSLTFAEGVPVASGTEVRYPLFTTTGSPLINALTAPATPPPGPGPVVNVPALSFAVFGPGEVPAGTYNLGIACTVGAASTTQLDKFWNVQMVIADAAADLPAKFTWAVSQAAATTTTTTIGATTTTVAGSTTTTTSGGTTTTTVGGTTTTSGATTTTSAAGASTSSTSLVQAVASPSSGGGSINQLSRTGGLSTPMILWSALLIIFGRMAVLLGRTPEVRTGGSR